MAAVAEFRSLGCMKSADATFFATPEHFRAWLRKHAATEPELIVGYWKVGSGRPSMTWPESVDEALCFGWIDGVRKRIDDTAYQIRFTRRRPTSIWSAVNLKKYEQLLAAGRVTEAGKRAYACRKEEKSKVYAYEQPAHADLTSVEVRAFKAHREAWKHFESSPPSYRKVLLHWITSARKPETRAARLGKLIAASRKGERLR
ncbi:MAG: YdeI/OmpD-associated family protein [Gammaproteobacteria bacterium]|nr:YdeI/OmpD-associated family protein [Gammaproteobacteria bacterium]